MKKFNEDEAKVAVRHMPPRAPSPERKGIKGFSDPKAKQLSREERVAAAAEIIRADKTYASVTKSGGTASRSASPATKRTMMDRLTGREPTPAVHVPTDPTDVAVDFVSVVSRGADINAELDLSESMTAEVASAVQAMYVADAEGDPRGAAEGN